MREIPRQICDGLRHRLRMDRIRGSSCLAATDSNSLCSCLKCLLILSFRACTTPLEGYFKSCGTMQLTYPIGV